ncbi:Arginase/deacetylase [Salix suchowensis]|nr:Arginase/deacetylase [Salix suchowensis]
MPSSPEQRPTIFLQNACYEHQYIRSKDSSLIVERPERLRAVILGLAAAIARLGDYSDALVAPGKPDDSDASDLADALSRIDINRSSTRDEPVNTIRSSASVQLMNNPAVKFIHGDIDGDKYLENLTLWIKESRAKIANDQSEIPDGLSQGDLYLCPGTLVAIQGALGTVCEAVDAVVNPKDSAPRAFVAIRPPGIIVAKTRRLDSASSTTSPLLQHTDGKPELVQAASVSIHGNHGQYIENIHLEEYTSEDHFWNDLYPNRYKRLFSKAKQFLDSTGGPGDDVLVFIRDAIEFSDQYARGRVVSVLEGGYSDRALTSGTLAHLCGLVGGTTAIDQSWWKTEHLEEDPWLARTMSVFSALEAEGPRPSKKAAVPVPISSRTLRERKTGPASNVKTATPTASKPTSPATKSIAIQKPRPLSRGDDDASSLSSLSSVNSDAEIGVPPTRKQPKVILRLGPKPEES